MPYGVKLHVWGEYACFTRPEMKVERVSYDAMTPSAARGVLEAIHWKPAIRWVVDRIHVLKPICFENLRRNELGSRILVGNITKAMKAGATEGLHTLIEDDRQQRAALLLRNVAYVIEAHFVLTDTNQAEPAIEAKHLAIFNRRADKGQCFHRPYLGTREFAAHFALAEGAISRGTATLAEGAMPQSELPPDQRNRDLGWMLHDIDYRNDMSPRFFRAEIRDGVIAVPPLEGDEVRA